MEKDFNNKVNTLKVDPNPAVTESPVVAPEPDAVPETTGTVDEASDTNVIGVVTDCAKLRVREKPNTDAEVLAEIKEGSEVMIDKNTSTEDFFAVCTEAGVEGYCMKKFIQTK